MATLSEIASSTRKIIKFGGIGFVAFIILRVGLLAGIAYWQKIHPAPPAPPTVDYGPLDKIQFPDAKYKPANYTLQLPTLNFPAFTDRTKVFLIPYQKPNFSVWDEAKRQASALGFTGDPEQQSTEVYSWTKKDPITTIFTLNIINGSFTYEYMWQNDPNILATKNLPGEKQAVVDTLDFLRGIKGSEVDALGQESKVIYLKVSGGKLEPAVSISEADLVQVNLYRPNIDDLSVVTPNPAQGVITALLSGSSSQKVLKVDYNYFPINSSLFATYPIKTPDVAWQELKDGKGFIASPADKIESVVVRRVYLGYYDALTPQTYLQPIYIFTGDNDFIGYVPAITSEWTK